MTLFEAIILGLVEGITEYLPVSSTGHLIITAALLKLDTAELKPALDTFEIVIQGGAILAVLGLYRQRVFQMIRGMIGMDRDGLRLALNIIIAFLPAAVLGVLLNDLIKEHLFYPKPVIGALAVGGLWMIAIDFWYLRRHRQEEREQGSDGASAEDAEDARSALFRMTPLQALGIGFLQCVAMWPGTSRSMMTIAGGVMLGLKPRDAAEFSFLLGLPTLGGACVYSLMKDGASGMIDAFGWTSLIVGTLVATVSAAIAVRWLVSFLNRHGLAGFGVYRLLLCVVLGVLAWRGVVDISPEEVDQSTTTSQSTP